MFVSSTIGNIIPSVHAKIVELLTHSTTLP